MNRRQRRNIEKSMGILKYKKTLSLTERMKRFSENNKVNVDSKRREIQEVEDHNSSAEISSMATSIMIKEGMSYVEALSKATTLYRNKKDK